VLACTWTSAKWPGRAPAGHALIRASLGGIGREEALAGDDDDLVRVVRDELRDVLGITAPPTLSRVFRWPAALPQYELGHFDRVAAVEAGLAVHLGLQLAGNAYRGIGIADCVQSGEAAADRVHAFLEERARRGAGHVTP
jgi:protoporphyrinogen/coproporphyrinogen III oxidase